MKWTQEQRAQAIRDSESLMVASDRESTVQSYNDAAIELACQRNELLEALKALCDSLRLRQGSKLIHFNHDELMELVPKGRAAIAKAEIQKDPEA